MEIESIRGRGGPELKRQCVDGRGTKLFGSRRRVLGVIARGAVGFALRAAGPPATDAVIDPATHGMAILRQRSQVPSRRGSRSQRNLYLRHLSQAHLRDCCCIEGMVIYRNLVLLIGVRQSKDWEDVELAFRNNEQIGRAHV